ncbi:MAG: DNRLRE domain-containing protein [Archangiaceae bacterium]|nr:DNRLRE domain-containing protein [Archangiaceae bacterium]
MVGLAAASPAHAQLQTTFRQGASPSAGYAGTQDVQLVLPDTDTVQDPNTNFNDTAGVNNRIDGYPVKQQPLLRWDVSSLPPGTVIASGSLQLYVTDVSVNPFEFFEVLRPWVDSQVTWNRASTGQAWGLPGAAQYGTDRDPAVVAVLPVTTTVNTLVSFPLTAAGVAMVQRWVNTPSTNHGVIGSNPFIVDRVSFNDSSDTTAAFRPLLHLVHSGGTVVEFQRGAKPSGSYNGYTDSQIALGPAAGPMNQTSLGAVAGTAAQPSASLLRFDVSSLPANAVISSVQLELQVENATASVSVYEPLRSWTEGATWTTYDGTNAWSTPGAQGAADRGTTLLGTLAYPSRGLHAAALNAAGVRLVQDWVSGARPNRGLLIDGDTADYLFVRDSEDEEVAQRPGLIVRYSGPPTKLTFVNQPADTTQGAVMVPVQVAVRDSADQVVEGAALSVTLALQSNPTGATLTGTLTVPVVNGIATFSDLALNRGGTNFTLRATSGSLTLADSAGFSIAGTDTTPPVAGAVSDGSGADVDTQAASDTLTANWSGFSDPESGIVGYAWAVGTSAGGTQVQGFTPVGTATMAIATGLTLANGATYFVTVRATNGIGQSVSASSDGVRVVAPFRSFRITGVASPAAAGTSHTALVEVLDGVGNPAPGYLGTVRLTSSDPFATLPPEQTFTAAEAGRHAAGPIVFLSAGAQSLTVTDTTDSSITGTLSGLQVVSAGAPSIVREASLSAAVSVPYRYSALGFVRAIGTAPLQFQRCAGPAGFDVDAATGSVRWTPASPGPQTLCVRAQNALGVDTYSFSVSVAATAPAGPTAIAMATPASGAAPLATVLSAAGSSADPTALPLRFRWDPGTGAVPRTEEAAPFTYVLPGSYRAEVTVFDAFGSSATASTTVSVLDAAGNSAPSARIVASALSGTGSLTVELSCDCQPGSSPIAGVHWRFDAADAYGPHLTRTFGVGRHRVRMFVTDTAGLTSTDVVEVVVSEAGRAPPTCRAWAKSTVGPAPFTTELVAEAASAGGTIASVLWFVDDDAAGLGSAPTLTFGAPGVHRVRLEVTDDAGATCGDEVWLTVLSAAGAAPAFIHSSASIAGSCGAALEGARGVASGSAVLSWSVKQGPEGFSIEAATGVMHYQPGRAEVGVHPVVIEVRNDVGVATQTLALTVSCGAPAKLSIALGCGAAPGPSLWALALLALWLLRQKRRA